MGQVFEASILVMISAISGINLTPQISNPPLTPPHPTQPPLHCRGGSLPPSLSPPQLRFVPYGLQALQPPNHPPVQGRILPHLRCPRSRPSNPDGTPPYKHLHIRMAVFLHCINNQRTWTRLCGLPHEHGPEQVRPALQSAGAP